ncbi:hypothetical protein BGZ50_006648 [Haplosporangium sp. Z 11]|nr:hypothetical protein BGZ50_006648 [Haplosporangium sp. Z 11]
MKDSIMFYRQESPYGEFSNFYYAPIVLDGHTWPTTEHYFQAQKFAHATDCDYMELIRLTSTPGSAAKMGRRRSWPLRSDWEHTKNDRYWADGGDGTGKNMLGKILMEVREKISQMSPEEMAVLMGVEDIAVEAAE